MPEIDLGDVKDKKEFVKKVSELSGLAQTRVSVETRGTATGVTFRHNRTDTTYIAEILPGECLECGEILPVKTDRGGPQKFCSTKCSSKFHNKKRYKKGN